MPDAIPAAVASNKPPVHFRLVRTAVSVLFGLIALALFLLWVRSYEICDVLCIWPDRVLAVSLEGRACILMPYKNYFGAHDRWLSVPAETVLLDPTVVGLRHGSFRPGTFYFNATYWLLVSLILPLAIVPWVPWSRRFSFRALAISATYLAVVAGALKHCVVVR